MALWSSITDNNASNKDGIIMFIVKGEKPTQQNEHQRITE